MKYAALKRKIKDWRTQSGYVWIKYYTNVSTCGLLFQMKQCFFLLVGFDYMFKDTLNNISAIKAVKLY